ncbi:MAG: hypothetical protein LBO77_03710 [Desulfovibrio sp.]|jgi:hypothetical protein|nr:hypothetical protein [Desulfovibrio sp.]
MILETFDRFDFLFLHRAELPVFAYFITLFALLGTERLIRIMIPLAAGVGLALWGAAFVAQRAGLSGPIPLAIFSGLWLASLCAAARLPAGKDQSARMLKKFVPDFFKAPFRLTQPVFQQAAKIPTSYLAMGCLMLSQIVDIILVGHLGLFEDIALFSAFWEIQSATLPAYGLFMIFLREARPSAHPTYISLFALVYFCHALMMVHGLDMDGTAAFAWAVCALTLGLYALWGSARAALALRILACSVCAAGLADVILRSLLPFTGIRLYSPDAGLIFPPVLLLFPLGAWFALSRRERGGPAEPGKKAGPVRRLAAGLGAFLFLVFSAWYALPLTLADLAAREGGMSRLAFILVRRGPALLKPAAAGRDLPGLAAAGRYPPDLTPAEKDHLALLDLLLLLLRNSGHGRDSALRYFAAHEAVACLSPATQGAPLLSTQLGCEALNAAFAADALPQALLLAKALTEKSGCVGAVDLALGDYRHGPSPYNADLLAARLRFFRTLGFAFDPGRQILDPSAFSPDDPAFAAIVSLLQEAGAPPESLLDPQGRPLPQSPLLSEGQRALLAPSSGAPAADAR